MSWYDEPVERKRNRHANYDGMVPIAEQCGIPVETLRYRVRTGMSLEDAIALGPYKQTRSGSSRRCRLCGELGHLPVTCEHQIRKDAS